MIDPKEIRPGNWVIKITGRDATTKSFFEYRAIAADEYYYTFSKVCFPIKITPAILGACGFKHEFGDWYLNRPVNDIDEGLPFLRLCHADHTWYLGKIKLVAQPIYLHQLQNLFYALLNKELPVHLGAFENTTMLRPIKFFITPKVEIFFEERMQPLQTNH